MLYSIMRRSGTIILLFEQASCECSGIVQATADLISADMASDSNARI
jgi:hypothetical protein